eukprot:CAMPEP_0115110464 /NCGR_PEP_ID=MMETSP0227-20121206/39395_1 /TAXON_ID=89957 /ORGANISM="Polarella glacialis, Strain CCMP 1383" /LENGTH=47 /DNA_ID= /DNA_START= /DNA_END= /DNA_ORIENTATION=
MHKEIEATALVSARLAAAGPITRGHEQRQPLEQQRLQRQQQQQEQQQ